MPKAYRALETRLARRLNARRNPHGPEPAPDIENAWLAAQVKHRERLPQWILDQVAQAQQLAGPSRLPLALIANLHNPTTLVVMELADFLAWHGGQEQP